MINSTNLPVVSGALGPAVATSDLASKKSIIANDVTGALYIEASGDGVAWCQVLGLSNSLQDKVIDVPCAFMRVDARKGTASNVDAIAEQSLVRSVTIPAPPANGVGASVDIADLNRIATVYAGAFTGKGNIQIEASGDGVNWAQVLDSFTTNGCKGGDVPAKFIRARGKGATATLSVSADDSDGSGTIINAPLQRFVFRPDDPLGARGNVYTDWVALYNAIRAVRFLGRVEIEFDFIFRTTFEAGLPSFTIPANTMGTGTAISGGPTNMTLTNPGGLFTPDMVGESIRIEGATTPSNNGNFLITGVPDANTLNYAHIFGAGVAEPYAGTWALCWQLSNVQWSNRYDEVVLFADYCFLDTNFYATDGTTRFDVLFLHGYNLNLMNNGSVTSPFHGIGINMGGSQSVVRNTVEGALSFFQLDQNLGFGFVGGEYNLYGGIGSLFGEGSPSPVIDINGVFLVVDSVPNFNNQTITDSAGGGVLIVDTHDTQSFCGRQGQQNWEMVTLPVSTTTLLNTTNRTRYLVRDADGVDPGPPTAGVGDSIAGTAPRMTLTDAAGLFTAAMAAAPGVGPAGLMVTIAGATTPANNGTFQIVEFISATQIVYLNSDGVAEVFPGTWSVPGYLATYNELVLVDTTAVASTIQLPTAYRAQGDHICIKDLSGNAMVNNITVQAKAGQTIDGAATAVIATNYGSLLLSPTGNSAWVIMASN